MLMSRRYRTLIEVVRLGSLTKAAEKTGYTQSGITHLLNSIEAEWGVTFVARNRNGVSLTSDGERLLPFVQDLVAAEEALHEQIDACKGLETGLVRIGSFSSVSTHALPRIIGSFRADYPGIDFEILHGTYSDIETWLHEGRVDLGFLVDPVDAKFESRFFFRDKIVAVLPEHFDGPTDCPLPLSEFEKHPFIMIEEGDGNRFRSYFRAYGIRPRIDYSVREDAVAVAMVESGLGISLDYELSLLRAPYRVVTTDLEHPAYREIRIAWNRRRKPSPIVRTFLDFATDDGKPHQTLSEDTR